MRKLELAFRIPSGDVGARYGDIILVRYVAASSDEAVARRIELAERELSRGRRAFFVHITRTARAPSGANRDRLAATDRQLGTSILASAIVIQSEGFTASGHRTAIAGMRLQSTPTYPSRVFTAVPEATLWLAEQLPGYTADEISRAADGLTTL